MDGNATEIVDSEHGKVVICPEYFDISTVSDVKNVFLSLLDEKPNLIVLNTEKMATIDTAAMQFLTSFVTDARKLGIEINYQDVEGSLGCAASSLGLSKHLGVDCID